MSTQQVDVAAAGRTDGHPALDPALERRLAELVEAQVQARVEARLSELLPARIAAELQRQMEAPRPRQTGRRRLAIVASKGTLDMAYPPLILASAAAAMGWEVDILHRRKLPGLKVAPLGNPAMPVPVPNFLGAIPGMTAMATAMMKRWFKRANIPTIQDLLDVTRESGVELIGCTTTMGVMGVREADLIDGVTLAGAGHFLDYAAEADVALFV